MQCETCWEERIAVLYKHDHTQSFSTTHCMRFVLRKRYAWRQRKALYHKFVLYWSRIRKVDNRINLIMKQENPQTTKAYRTAGHESQRNSQKVDSAVRQRKVEEVDHRHGQYGDLRAFRNLCLETMLRMCLILGNCHRILFMWKKFKTLAKNRTVRQEERWRFINSRLRHQKKNLTHGAKHGALQKARQSKHGGYKTIWERWHKNDTSLCHMLGGLRSRLFSMTNLHWKNTPKLRQQRKELVTRKVGYSSWIKKVLKDHWINVLILLKQNEKWKDYMMNMWKRLQKEIHLFIQYSDQDNEETNN